MLLNLCCKYFKYTSSDQSKHLAAKIVTEVLVSMTDCVMCNNMSRDTSGHLKMGKIERRVAL